MKRFILLLCISTLLLCSCHKPESVEPDVKFYVDGVELQTDTLYPSLNSYVEVKIVAVTPDICTYTWRSVNDYPINLRNAGKNFHVMREALPLFEQDYVNGFREVSEFRMLFSDTLYHAGDLYKLKVSSSDTYERTLNFVVVP